MNEKGNAGEKQQPEGLEKEIYGGSCPELEWMTDEELQRICESYGEGES